MPSSNYEMNGEDISSNTVDITDYLNIGANCCNRTFSIDGSQRLQRMRQEEKNVH
jgi:hypothetical protein